MVKLPARPAAELVINPTDIAVVPALTALWRIHPTAGSFVLPWNRLRHFGPTSNRFDPHPPPGLHPHHAVSYAALDAMTPFAEVFQRNRTINRSRGGPYLTGWLTTRQLRLLDLTGDWPVANGASHATNSGRQDYCRAWARAIHDHPAQVNGLQHQSAMTGAPAVTLFTSAADSFPPSPIFTRPLADPAIEALVIAAAERYRYLLVG